eukprot:COSAG02_NODE_46598_length_347_cov_1.141129_1_plen_40_part_01
MPSASKLRYAAHAVADALSSELIIAATRVPVSRAEKRYYF